MKFRDDVVSEGEEESHHEPHCPMHHTNKSSDDETVSSTHFRSHSTPSSPSSQQAHNQNNSQKKDSLQLTIQADVEFNDGTLSPYPVDPIGYCDPYNAAWNCLSEREEDEYLQSDEYTYFERKLSIDGKLVLVESDLITTRRWKTLGFFLAHNGDVQSLRFQGVNLQRSDFSCFRQVMLSSALATTARPPRKRRNRSIPSQCDNDSTGSLSCTSSSTSSAASSVSAASTPSSSTTTATSALSPANHLLSLRSEWTGGWGVDIDQIHLARRKTENKLRHVTFIDNNLGTKMHYSQEELQSQDAQSHTQSQQSATSSSSASTSSSSSSSSSSSQLPTALSNVVSMLLFCHLLESCNLWRNSIQDEHAVQLCEELLGNHPSLKTLSLKWNSITHVGAKGIENVLNQIQQKQQEQRYGSSGNVQEVDLSFNRIDPSKQQSMFLETLCQRDEEVKCPDVTTAVDSPEVSNPTPPTAASSASSSTISSSSSPRPMISVNLRSQLPHSTRMLSHFLRLTSVHKLGRSGKLCSQQLGDSAPYHSHPLNVLRTLKSSA